jgi:predicted nucleic acid-binding protein
MAAPESLFVDTDVALDHLTGRQPFAEFAHRLFGLAERGELQLWISAVTLANIFYIVRKLTGRAAAVTVVRDLRSLVRIAPLGSVEVDAAFSSGFKDFEDALQYSAAQSVGTIKAIITRNSGDYATSVLPVFAPEEYLAGHSARLGN